MKIGELLPLYFPIQNSFGDNGDDSGQILYIGIYWIYYFSSENDYEKSGFYRIIFERNESHRNIRFGDCYLAISGGLRLETTSENNNWFRWICSYSIPFLLYKHNPQLFWPFNTFGWINVSQNALTDGRWLL